MRTPRILMGAYHCGSIPAIPAMLKYNPVTGNMYHGIKSFIFCAKKVEVQVLLFRIQNSKQKRQKDRIQNDMYKCKRDNKYNYQDEKTQREMTKTKMLK